MRRDTLISEAAPTGTLVKPPRFREGENLLFQEPEVGRLVAEVARGALLRYRAFDAKGREVPTVLIREPEPEAPAKPGARRRRGKTIVRICACFPTGDRCWWESW